MSLLSRLKNFSRNSYQALKQTPALVIAAAIGASGLTGSLVGASIVLVKGARTFESGLTVTGSATQSIQSDMANWLIKIESTGSTQTKSYRNHQVSIKKTLDFLESNGIREESIKRQTLVLGPANSQKKEIRNPKNGELISTTWTTSQWFRIESRDVNNIFKTHQKIGQLIGEGVLVKPNKPKFTYTKLAEKRVDMIAKATKDARLRAEAIALQTGSQVGSVKKVNTGVFQITVPNSTRVSSWGSYDTSTIKKDITAVMGVTFSIE